MRRCFDVSCTSLLSQNEKCAKKISYNENSEEISVTERGTIKIKINGWYEIYVYLKIPINQTLIYICSIRNKIGPLN